MLEERLSLEKPKEEPAIAGFEVGGGKEHALKEMEGLGIFVPESVASGEEGEETYFHEFVRLHMKIERMLPKPRRAKDEEERREVFRERNESWSRMIELIRLMKAGIFTKRQHQEFGEALENWNRSVNEAFERRY